MAEDGEVDREIARLERLELEQERAQQAIVSAARRCFSERLAGIWAEEDGNTLVVALTGDLDRAQEELRAIASIPLKIVPAMHSLVELEALCEQLEEAAEHLGAPLAAIAIMEPENAVEVTLKDLKAPNSITMRECFASSPVCWVEDTIELA